MDNATHTLLGLALARAGLDRVPHATTTLVLASNVPDLDGLPWLWGDRATYLHVHHHLSHSLVGMAVLGPVIAAAVTLAVRGGGRAWKALTAVAWCGLLAHLLLDLVPTYGIRPLLPFDDRWLHGDLLFVVDPWFWCLLAVAAMLGGPVRSVATACWMLAGVLTVVLVWTTDRTGPGVATLYTAVAAVLLTLRLHGTGRGRRRTLAAAGLILAGLYVAAFAVLRTAVLDRARPAMTAHYRPDAPLQGFTTQARFAVPWRFDVLAATDRNLYRAGFDLTDPTPRFDPPRLRHLDLLDGHHDHPVVRAFLSFARHPFVVDRGDDLLLCSGRYGWSARPSWCNLAVIFER